MSQGPIKREDFRSLSDLDLLCALVAGEAAGEAEEGQMCVAHVVMNRVKRGFGKDLHDVALKPSQFSCFDAPRRYHDMWLAASPAMQQPWVVKLREVCARALAGSPDPTCGADHYFAAWIPTPKWADKMRETVRVGTHIFFDSGRR